MSGFGYRWSRILIAAVVFGGGSMVTLGSSAEGTAIVVETVSPEAAPGLLPGDVLSRWRRRSETQTTTTGQLARPTDFWWLKRAEIPRQPVELEVQRDDQTFWLELGDGPWRVELRPQLTPEALTAYRDGRSKRSETPLAVLHAWRQHHKLSSSEPGLQAWWAAEILDTQIRFGNAGATEDDLAQLLDVLPDPLDQLYVLERLSAALKHTGDFETSSARIIQGLETIRSNNLGSLLQAYWQNWLGILDLGSGRLESAQVRFKEASEQLDQSAPRSMLKATALSGLGHVARQQGELDAAEAAWKQLAPLYRQLAPGSRFESETFNNLGIAAHDRGLMSMAEGHFRRSLAIAEQLDPNSRFVAVALNNLAECHRQRGQLVEGEKLAEQSITILSDAAPVSHEMALALDTMGAIAQDRGDLAWAEEHYRRMIEIYRRLAPQSLDTAFGLHRLAALALARGTLDDALTLTTESHEIRLALAPANPELADSLLQLAEIARRQGELGKARELALKARDRQTAIAPEGLRTSESHHLLGELDLASPGRIEAAIESLDKALKIRQRLAPHSALEAATLRGLGRAWRDKAPEVAAQFYQQSLAALESQIGRLGGTELQRSHYRANAKTAYDEYAALLLAQERPVEAFDIVERSRARGFLELLAGRDLLSDELSPELVDQRRDLAVQYERVQEQIRIAPSPDPALIHELDRLRRRYERLSLELQRLSPKYLAARPKQALNLEQAARTLDHGTLLLSFQSAASGGQVFALSKDGRLRTAPIPPEPVLRNQIDLLNRLISGTGSSAAGQRRQRRAESLLRTLYRQLLVPLATTIDEADRLLVLADGPLHHLPWAALVQSPEGEPVRYLIESKAVYLALSATVHDQLTAARPTNRKPISQWTLAAFGDPDYGSGKPPVAWRSAIRRGLEMNPLPASRFEVERIANLFPRSKAFIGRSAIEEEVKSLPRNTQLVHFAVHGLLDAHSPLDSALVLSQPKDVSASVGFGGDNGLLQAWEIFESVRLDADLVMLSACRTGLGKELAGEGLIGLTRAFQIAGARSVAAALWQVSDLHTQALVVRFYHHLRSGETKVDALRAAQLDLLTSQVSVVGMGGIERSVDASLPLHWAGFQLYGDWQ